MRGRRKMTEALPPRPASLANLDLTEGRDQKPDQHGVPCPFCGESTRVIDSRVVEGAVRRRRSCKAGHRFTTYERVETATLTVVKKDGRREEFNRRKLLDGIRLACTKRPISIDLIGQMVDAIEMDLYRLGQAEVQSRTIGELAMRRLRDLDPIAYLRFASVYRSIEDLDDLKEEVESLERSGRIRARPETAQGPEAEQLTLFEPAK